MKYNWPSDPADIVKTQPKRYPLVSRESSNGLFTCKDKHVLAPVISPSESIEAAEAAGARE